MPLGGMENLALPDSSTDSDAESLNSALFCAIYKRKGKEPVKEENKIQAIKAVLKDGCDINAADKNNKGNTLLHIAVKKGYSKITKFLLTQHNINICIANEDGKTPLELAKEMKTYHSVNLLETFVAMSFKSMDNEMSVSKSISKEKDNSEFCKNSVTKSYLRKCSKNSFESDNADSKKGFALSCHGMLFQFNLIMLIIKRGLKKNLNFYLGTEIEQAGKFDDVVFKFEKSGKYVHFLIQAKHFADRSKGITEKDLHKVGKKGRKLALAIYFKSYLKIKTQKQFKNEDIFYFLCTNISFNISKAGHISLEKTLDSAVLLKEGTCYKLKLEQGNKLHSTLVEVFKEYTGNTFYLNAEKEIELFLDKFVFIVDLPDENDLYNVVKSEIGDDSQFTFRDDERFIQSFREEIINWMKGKEQSFLSAENCDELLKMIELSNSKIIAQLVSDHCLSKYSENNMVKFSAESINPLKDIVMKYSSKDIVITTGSIMLSSLKVCQILREQFCNFLFINLDMIGHSQIKKRVFHCLCADNSFVLVIPCENEVSEEILFEVGSDLSYLKSNVIIIINDNYSTEAESFENCIYHEDKISCSDLTFESKQKLLKKTISFQGLTIPLEQVIGNKLELVDVETLEDIVKGKDVAVGKHLAGFEENNFYLERAFQLVEISLEKLAKEKCYDYIIIKNADGKVKQQLVDENFIFLEDPTDQDINNEIQIILNGNEKSNCHILNYEAEKLFWCQTYGLASEIVQHVEENPHASQRERFESAIGKYSEDDFLNHVENQKFVVISDTAGMGKTTVLASISQKIAIRDSSLWVARVDLNDHSQVLAEAHSGHTLFGVQTSIDFIATKLLKLKGTSLNIFRYQCLYGGKMVLMFDGFDEISPNYDKMAIDIFQSLKESRVKQVWITTRPNMKMKLENNLHVFANTLRPFSNKDQINFLVEFWRDSLVDRSVETEVILHRFAADLIDLMSKSISDKEKQFAGIPLLTKMLADAFQDHAKCHLLKGTYLPVTEFNIIKLYELFVRKKYNIFLKDKMKSDLSITSADYSSEKLYKLLLEEHELLAIYSICDMEDVKLVLPQTRIDELLHEVEIGKEKSGIIERISDRKVKFVHRTFLEFFVATFLLKHLDSHPVYQNFFFTEILLKSENQVIRLFINGMLKIKNSQCHLVPCIEVQNIMPQILQIAIMEGNVHILNFLLTVHENVENLLRQMVKKENQNNGIFTRNAAKLNHFEMLELLINEGAVINISDSKDNELHIASKWGSIECIKVLIKNKVNVSVKNSSGETALHYAATYGQTEIMKLLLSSGADVNALNEYHVSPLLECGSVECVKILISHKVYINIKDLSGDSYLHHAAKRGQVEIVKLLVEAGADVNSVNRYGKTPLHNALEANNTEIVKMLLLNNASVNIRDTSGDTYLHLAVRKDNVEILQQLIDCGADVRAVNKFGRTPLYNALESGNFQNFEVLINNNANVNFIDSAGYSYLHFAVRRGQVEMTRLLIDSRVDVNSINRHGKTPLHYASKTGNLEIIRTLIMNNANVNLKDTVGDTALHFAARSGQTDILIFLITSGANVNAVNQYNISPLLDALKSGTLRSIKTLINHNADVNIKDYNGNTPLHYAASRTRIGEIMRILKDVGADGNAVNTFGETAADEAMKFWSCGYTVH